MHYYSDPTANRGLSDINRQFSRMAKKAKNLKKLLDDGQIIQADIDRAQSQFTGLYRHVLTHVLNGTWED